MKHLKSSLFILIILISALPIACTPKKEETNQTEKRSTKKSIKTTFSDSPKNENAFKNNKENQNDFQLTNFSDSYPHNISGTKTHPTTIVVNDKSHNVSPKVIEGPVIKADLNNDQKEDYIFAVSDSKVGSSILALDHNLKKIAQSEPVGQGFRWRHIIAIDKFGPNQEIEIATVRTPHIGGVVEFYQLKNNKLILTASKKTFKSHKLGSNNFDMATHGDFNENNIPELIVPNFSMTEIVGLERIKNSTSLKEVYRLKLDHTLQTSVIYNKEKNTIKAGTKEHIRTYKKE